VTFLGGHLPNFLQLQGPNENLTVSTGSSFESILKASTFVDKTLFIKKVFVRILRPKVMITAPRKFGKSVNLDMFRRFIELEVDKETGKQITTVDLESETVCDTPNYKLFTVNQNSEEMHLQIMAHDEFVKTHFGKYPIINVSFLCSEDVTSETDALNLFKKSIHEAFKNHPYLYKSSESKLKVDERCVCKQWCTEEGRRRNYKQFEPTDVVNGLRDLSEYLKIFHGRKVFLLIDEFDSIVSKAVDTVADKDELRKIVGVVMGAIGGAVKGNEDNLAGILITGILDLFDSFSLSLLCNMDRVRFGDDDPCLKYYGFNLEEVEKLFEIFSVDEGLRKKAITKYNCYCTKRGDHGIFNPYAVVRFLESHMRGDASLQNYWQESGNVQCLHYLLKNDEVNEMIRRMLQGDCLSDISKSSDQMDLESLTQLYIANRDSRARISMCVVGLFLLRQGYLSYIRRREGLPTAVGIPDDLRPVFIEKMVEHLTQHCGINDIAHKDCQNLLNNVMHVANKDKAEFVKALKSFTDKVGELIETTSMDPCNEAGIETVVSSVVLAAGYTCANQGYNFKHNRVIAHKDGQGIMIELKYKEESSRGALAQLFTQGCYKNFINEKHYDGSDIKLHLAMGLHFTEKIEGSKVKATVHCLRNGEINEVLKELNIEKVDRTTGTEIVTEVRIEMACAENEGTNSFVEKAICVT
jgi:hypothetical protein